MLKCIAQISDVAAFEAPLPYGPPREQTVPFDFTGANLLWERRGSGRRHRPPGRTAFPTLELGRVMYEPHTVVDSDTWREAAVEGVLTYGTEVRTRGPRGAAVRPADGAKDLAQAVGA